MAESFREKCSHLFIYIISYRSSTVKEIHASLIGNARVISRHFGQLRLSPVVNETFRYIINIVIFSYIKYSPGTGTGIPGLPSGAELDRIVQGSFNNVDSNNDGVIERSEFDTLVIVADADSKCCKAKKKCDVLWHKLPKMRAILQGFTVFQSVIPVISALTTYCSKARTNTCDY